MEEEGFIEIEDKLLFFKKILTTANGEKPTLVFLHSALGSVIQWKHFPKLLSLKTGMDALVFDRIGHGKSSSSQSSWNNNYLHIEAFTILPEVLKRLNISRPVFIGHSDGATIALLYASRFRTEALICEAAHVLVEDKTVEAVQKTKLSYNTIADRLSHYHGSKTEKLFTNWSDRWMDPGFKNWNITKELKSVSCPCLLIQGRQDEYASPEHVEIIKKYLNARTEVVMMDDCGHTPHKEAMEQTLEAMAGFIESTVNTKSYLN
ncbi:MAG: alpha/beta hydrolase [Saprospiraceae bacterium]|nr:alpha/beta hydrolase [Saprospiraceae bacterium]